MEQRTHYKARLGNDALNRRRRFCYHAAWPRACLVDPSQVLFERLRVNENRIVRRAKVGWTGLSVSDGHGMPMHQESS